MGSSIRLFKRKRPIRPGLWWIGYNGPFPLFERVLTPTRGGLVAHRFPNDSSVFSAAHDGSFGYTTGIGCTPAFTNNTWGVSIDLRFGLDSSSVGGLDFDTSSLTADATVTSATLSVYRHSFSKTKTLDTVYDVLYYTGSVAFSSPVNCNDDYQTWTYDSTGSWANTTGWFNQSIGTSRIQKTGHTTFRLVYGWSVGGGEFKTANVRANEYTPSGSAPYLTVVYSLGGPPQRMLMGVGT